MGWARCRNGLCPRLPRIPCGVPRWGRRGDLVPAARTPSGGLTALTPLAKMCVTPGCTQTRPDRPASLRRPPPRVEPRRQRPTPRQTRRSDLPQRTRGAAQRHPPTRAHRDGHQCQACGAPATHVDHIIPLAHCHAYGIDPLDPANCRALCASCSGTTDAGRARGRAHVASRDPGGAHADRGDHPAAKPMPAPFSAGNSFGRPSAVAERRGSGWAARARRSWSAGADRRVSSESGPPPLPTATGSVPLRAAVLDRTPSFHQLRGLAGVMVDPGMSRGSVGVGSRGSAG